MSRKKRYGVAGLSQHVAHQKKKHFLFLHNKSSLIPFIKLFKEGMPLPEAQDRPAPLQGYLSELLRGFHGMGVAHKFQQRDIRMVVTVGKR